MRSSVPAPHRNLPNSSRPPNRRSGGGSSALPALNLSERNQTWPAVSCPGRILQEKSARDGCQSQADRSRRQDSADRDALAETGLKNGCF